MIMMFFSQNLELIFAVFETKILILFYISHKNYIFSIFILSYIYYTNFWYSFFLYFRLFCLRLIFFMNIKIFFFFCIRYTFMYIFILISSFRFAFRITCVIYIIIWLGLNWFKKLASFKSFIWISNLTQLLQHSTSHAGV